MSMCSEPLYEGGCDAGETWARGQADRESLERLRLGVDYFKGSIEALLASEKPPHMSNADWIAGLIADCSLDYLDCEALYEETELIFGEDCWHLSEEYLADWIEAALKANREMEAETE